MLRHTSFLIRTLCLASGLLLGLSSAMAATFPVDTTSDTHDATPGDGICADAGGACSLRAALEEANALAGADVITVRAGNYVLTQGQLVIKDEVTVSGAYTKLTVIDGNASNRIFSISSGVGPVTLETMTLQNGHVTSTGGGVATGNSLLIIRNAILRDNAATGFDAWGGALYIWGPGNKLVVENSLITRNSAEHASAIRSSNSDVVLRNTTLSYNHTRNARYGVIVDYSSQPTSITLENTTLTGNTGGTGMTLFEAQTTIVNSTIAGNSGGAAINAERNSRVTVTNSILYGNNSNCSTNGGAITSGGNNIDGRNTCGFNATGDLVNTHPMLGPLADNGGPTPTRGLLAGSPALNAGDNTACLSTDQRGAPRDDGACDIGAFEGSVRFANCLGAVLAVDSTVDTVDASAGDGICADADGMCTLRAAIQEANACAGVDTITLPAGTYALTIPGINENAALTGDLDILDDLEISGAGASASLIDASDAAFDDRIFHVLNNATTDFSALALQGVSNSNLAGGGIATGGDLRVSHVTCSGNSAGNGTCLYATGSGTTVDVADSTLSNNNGNGSGAGIYVGNYVTLTVSDSTLSNNVQRYEYGHQGAAIWGGLGATLNIVHTLIDNNSSGYASSIYGHNNSVINISDSTVSNSQAGTRGVIGGDGSTVNISRSTITANLAGGLSTRGLDSTLNMTDTTLSNNEAHALGSFTAHGAGADIGGAFTITGSTISGNRIINDGYGGSGSGAGIYIAGTGSITNTTISGNRNGGQNSRGGAIGGPGNLTLINSTVYKNTSYYGGGIGMQNGTLSIANSIVAGNSADCDASYTTVTSNGHNIESQNSCGFTDPTDQVNTDPLLDVLADNGGWTQTHTLLTGSPALDAGDAVICAGTPVNGMDQRGFTRPWGAGCDIGAYEDMPLYTLSLAVSGAGNGRVHSTPGAIDCQTGTCSSQIGENTPVLFSATPDANSVFDGWSGDCTTTESGQGSVLMDADKACTASFSPIQHTLSVVISPLGKGGVTGVTNKGQSNATVVIDCGADCTETLPGVTGVIDLVPSGTAMGWSFASWSGCDNVNNGWCTMTLDTDKVLTANFVSAHISIDDGIAPLNDLDMPFGDVLTGTSTTRTVTISNTGEGGLYDIWVEDSDYLATPFSLAESCSDSSLQPGKSCSFTVTFSPTETGTFTDSFDIIAQDPDTPTLTITVSGTGIVETPIPTEEPLPTAEITFRAKGSGGGAAGPMDLLLVMAGLAFAAGRRRSAHRATLTLACLLALSLTTSPPATAADWYLGASGGVASSDYSDSDLRNHLVGKGYAVTSVSVDDSDYGWKLFAGYRIAPNWAIEAAWVDLGDVTSVVEGTIDNAQVPALLSDAARDHGYLGKGVTVAGVGIWPVTPQFDAFVKLGGFRWTADIKIDEQATGRSIDRSASGTDLMGGIGVRYAPDPLWEIRAEYEYYDIGADPAGFVSLGVAYHF